MKDQISRLSMSGIRASVISVKKSGMDHMTDNCMNENEDNLTVDFSLCEDKKLRDGHYHIVFAHPETFISSKYGRELVLSEKYRENVLSVVVDEAHCILDWGTEFRKDYGKLGVLCAMFPDVPVLALTATASQADITAIQDSLGLKKCKTIIANPDRKNIFYQKVYRKGKDMAAIESILKPIAFGLLQNKIEYPLTIVYTPLKLCGFAYKLFEYVLGAEQYFPSGSTAIPANRLFAQFHAPQTDQMKDEILKQLCSGKSIVRVVFATVAIGMGVDIPNIRKVIHVVPPTSIKAYFQETGRAGRDGKRSEACLYYNRRDIAKNRVGMQDDMRNYCETNDKCLRRLLLRSLDYQQDSSFKMLHFCCCVCRKKCECSACLEELELLMVKL